MRLYLTGIESKKASSTHCRSVEEATFTPLLWRGLGEVTTPYPHLNYALIGVETLYRNSGAKPISLFQSIVYGSSVKFLK